MIRQLLIDRAVQDNIDSVVRHAAENSITLEQLSNLPLAELLDVGEESRCVVPVGHSCAFTFEYYPCGLVRHLSISVDEPFMLPSPASVAMIAKAFGFNPQLKPIMFIDNCELGLKVVNLIQPMEASA